MQLNLHFQHAAPQRAVQDVRRPALPMPHLQPADAQTRRDELDCKLVPIQIWQSFRLGKRCSSVQGYTKCEHMRTTTSCGGKPSTGLHARARTGVDCMLVSIGRLSELESDTAARREARNASTGCGGKPSGLHARARTGVEQRGEVQPHLLQDATRFPVVRGRRLIKRVYSERGTDTDLKVLLGLGCKHCMVLSSARVRSCHSSGPDSTRLGATQNALAASFPCAPPCPAARRGAGQGPRTDQPSPSRRTFLWGSL